MTESVRWGLGKRDDEGEFARNQLIEAAIHCYRQKGIRSTKMGDIAKQAQVSRATLYKYFKGREDILGAVYRIDVDQFNDNFKKRCARYKDFCGLLLGYMIYSMTESAQFQNFELYFNEDSAPWVEAVLLYDEGAVESSCHLLSPYFEKAQQAGEIREDINLIELVSWAHRINSSHILSPGFSDMPVAKLRRTTDQFFIQSLRAR